ncbi:hypothetical protein F5Y16DRAFT_378124 [Xylariaceae sp. FL0255]|nr:hypothetical protein F5Y16DRAFT_378124 [Xylariaceae sp. FL0255]
MEKYSQFRDRGSGISPFLPTSNPSSLLSTLLGTGFLLFRLPLLLSYSALYFLILDHLPLPQFARKILLWTLLGIPWILWADLQLDGVKRGSLAAQTQKNHNKLPSERAIIAAQFTSPVDAVYLAAVFDPIFVLSFPGTRKVQRVSLFRAMTQALASPSSSLTIPHPLQLTTLRALVEANPHRVIAVFPEMTTTNGKGILPFSPSLLSAPAHATIFPVSLRYTPADITTPVPGAWGAFLWNLLSQPTHSLRVRIAEGVANTTADVNGVDAEKVVDESDEDSEEDGTEDEENFTPEEKRLLDHVGDTLARLARNKRVGLRLKDKAAFVEAWSKKRR